MLSISRRRREGALITIGERVQHAILRPVMAPDGSRPAPAPARQDIELELEHSGDGLTDDVALVPASSRDNVT